MIIWEALLILLTTATASETSALFSPLSVLYKKHNKAKQTCEAHDQEWTPSTFEMMFSHHMQ